MSDTISALKTKPKQLLKRLFRSRFSRRIIASLLAFFILVPTILILFRPLQASAVWFDDNYLYRQKFTFTHNADITSERSITVSLDTAEFISDGIMQSDCDDTRFTDLNGKLLRYQLTGTCNNTATTYEVIFPTIINGTNVGYVYYGNPRAASASQDVSDVTALTPSGGDPAITHRGNEEKAPTPALFLMFDEGYGSVTQDASPNNNNGGVRGATWKSKDLCLSGNCLYFDGVDDSVIATNAATIDFDTGLATGSAFQAWIRVNSTGENSLGQIFNKGANTFMRVKNASNGRADLEASLDLATTDATLTVSQSIELNKWTHVAMTYTDDGDDEITLYVNGVNKGSSTNGSGAPAPDTNDLVIGGPNQAHFKGFIDAFKIYSYERTNAQVNTDVGAVTSLHGTSASFGDDQFYLSDGLVGYWKMDDGVGNPCPGGVDKACDSSGNGNTGTWTGGVASTSGKFAFATNYDGVDDYVNAGDINEIDSATQLTYCAWVYSNSTNTDDGIISKENTAGGSNNGRSTLFRDNVGVGGGDLFTFYVQESSATGASNTSVESEGGTSKLNTWIHVCGTFKANDTNGLHLYINGYEQASRSASTVGIENIDAGSQPVQIGDETNFSKPFDGKIDDVRIYNRALSSSEVSRLYDWGPGPVGYWKLDERTGTQAVDSSGNGNTGTLTNNPQWTPGKLGSGLQFDGASNYVDAGTGSSISDIKTLTVSAWIKMNTTGGGSLGRIATKRSGGFGGWSLSVNDEGGLDFNQDFDGTLGQWRASGPMTLNNWYHVAVVYDCTSVANTPKLYINGTVYTITTTFSSPTGNCVNDASFPLQIGSEYNRTDRIFDGTIDDVRVYNYNLTPKQVGSVMNADHPAVGSPVGSAFAHYKFDEGYGTTANNSGSQGSTINGTLSGMDSPATYGSGWTNHGKFGKAIAFDGVNDFITLPAGAASLKGLSAATVSFWTYTQSENFASGALLYIGTGTSGSTRVSITYQADGRMSMKWRDLDANPRFDLFSQNALSLNSWHLVTITFDSDSDNLIMYIDGVQVAGDTQVKVPIDTTNSADTIAIGSYTNPGLETYFKGRLDDFKLYDYALSADEVKVEYNQGKAVVLGSLSTDPDGTTASNSAARAYCPPGDTATCNAPIGHWTLDERTGTTANDISGNANTGTLTNGPEWVTGKVGQALGFDGVDDYVDAGDIANADNSSAITVSAWVKPSVNDSANVLVIASKTRGTTGFTGWLLTRWSDETYRFQVFDGVSEVYAISDTAYADTSWHHVVGVYNGVDVKIYIDGVSADSTPPTAPASIPDTTRHVCIGQTNGGGGTCEGDPSTLFPGTLDDVRIYNYALTPAQIAWEYNRGGPVGWWRLDECTGATAYDASGKGNNGTITIGGTGPQTSAGNCVTTDTAAAWYNGKDGKFNSALNFDGSDDYITVTDPASGVLDFGSSQDFSIALWIKTSTAGTNPRIVSKAGAGKYYAIRVDDQVSKMAIDLNDGTNSITILGNTVVTNNTWYHVVATLQRNGNGQLYINGATDGNPVSITSIGDLSNAGNLDIGRTSGGGNYIQGQIDDVRVYNYTLTPTQIQILYNENSAVRFGPLSGSP